jgi:coenzyme F420-reducing hydrogenase alpha subunit
LTRSKNHPLVKDLKAAEGFGLGARLIACLTELSQIPAQMLSILDTLNDSAKPDERPALGDGVGVAQIGAARGRLVHAVEMAGDKVMCYRILAPTEWNFHPHGAAAHGLAKITAARREDCANLARFFVTAVDPWVGANVRVR